jgi:transcription antitermination factor NusA-like protein
MLILIDCKITGGRKMKMPICSKCLKSGTLCEICNQKLENGEISSLDVELARALYSIAKNYHLGDVTFKKSIEVDGLIVMIVGEGDIGSVIGKRGRFIRILRRKFNTIIRVVEDTDDLKKWIDELIYPAKISGINIVYPVSGEERYKIRVDKRSREKMPAEKSVVENAIRKITKRETEIIFE